MKCELCSGFGRSAILAGGIPVVLCDKHRRAWDTHCNGLPEFHQYYTARGEYEVTLTAISGGNASVAQGMEAHQAMVLATQKLRMCASDWFDGQEKP